MSEGGREGEREGACAIHIEQCIKSPFTGPMQRRTFSVWVNINDLEPFSCAPCENPITDHRPQPVCESLYP